MNKEQIMNGIVRYFDSEVAPKIPVAARWVAGSAILIAMRKVDAAISKVNSSEIAKAFELVDNNGNWDIDMIAETLAQSAQKYGKLLVTKIPGTPVSFSDEDVILLKEYIKGER